MESDLSIYPRNTRTDDSPSSQLSSTLGTFDDAYLVDVYTNMPDHSLETFFDTSYFDCAISPGEFPGSLDMNVYPFGIGSAQPFERLEQTFASDFPDLDPPFNPTIPISPCYSTASSIGPQSTLISDDTFTLASTPLSTSPSSVKREAPTESTTPNGEPAPKYPQRKRGRPRKLSVARSVSPISSSSSKHQQRTIRQSHTQVERKYREGLNSDLERLRRAVPMLTQSSECASIGQPKPSKAMVLVGAIDYIKDIEREMEGLREEIVVLNGGVEKKANGKGVSRSKSKRQGPAVDLLDNEYKPNSVF